MKCSAEPKADGEIEADHAIVYVIDDKMVWPVCLIHLEVVRKQLPDAKFKAFRAAKSS